MCCNFFYVNQLIKHPLNSIKYKKLACYLHWLILTVNNVSVKVGTWMGGKAVPCTVPAFDMGAIVSLNFPLNRQVFERYEKISLSNELLRWCLQTLKKSRFYCSRRALHLRSRKHYNSENMTYKIHFAKLKNDWSL